MIEELTTKIENSSNRINKYAEIKIGIPGKSIIVKKRSSSFEKAIKTAVVSAQRIIKKKRINEAKEAFIAITFVTIFLTMTATMSGHNNLPQTASNGTILATTIVKMIVKMITLFDVAIVIRLLVA